MDKWKTNCHCQSDGPTGDSIINMRTKVWASDWNTNARWLESIFNSSMDCSMSDDQDRRAAQCTAKTSQADVRHWRTDRNTDSHGTQQVVEHHCPKQFNRWQVLSKFAHAHSECSWQGTPPSASLHSRKHSICAGHLQPTHEQPGMKRNSAKWVPGFATLLFNHLRRHWHLVLTGAMWKVDDKVPGP